MCGRAVHPTKVMRERAREIVMDEREAEQHAWTEQKMREHITELQHEITQKRSALAHAQKRLLAHLKRRSA